MRDKWLSVDVYSEENKKRISRIIEIEWELTEAIRAGHKSHWGDQFKEKRNEMVKLRKELIDGK
jgi:Mg2+ and Co2+ transporter CorA